MKTQVIDGAKYQVVTRGLIRDGDMFIDQFGTMRQSKFIGHKVGSFNTLSEYYRNIDLETRADDTEAILRGIAKAARDSGCAEMLKGML